MNTISTLPFLGFTGLALAELATMKSPTIAEAFILIKDKLIRRILRWW
jgi:hypothetical protein